MLVLSCSISQAERRIGAKVLGCEEEVRLNYMMHQMLGFICDIIRADGEPGKWGAVVQGEPVEPGAGRHRDIIRPVAIWDRQFQARFRTSKGVA